MFCNHRSFPIKDNSDEFLHLGKPDDIKDLIVTIGLKIRITSNIKHSNKDKYYDGANNGKYSAQINNMEDRKNGIESYDEDNDNSGVKRKNEAYSNQFLIDTVEDNITRVIDDIP